ARDRRADEAEKLRTAVARPIRRAHAPSPRSGATVRSSLPDYPGCFVTAGPHRPGPPPVSTERRRIATTVTESADLAVPVHPDLPDEQRELDQMYTRLDRLRADAQRRRSAALLQSGGDDPQARSERDSYVQDR